MEVPLPAQCPRCGGGLEECATVSQFQTEIPEPRVERIEFRIQVGRCRCCQRRVQGRHPRQISNAIGGAASPLGPRALATLLSKGLGLPYGKTATVLEHALGAGGESRWALPSDGTYGREGADLASVGRASSWQSACDSG